MHPTPLGLRDPVFTPILIQLYLRFLHLRGPSRLSSRQQKSSRLRLIFGQLQEAPSAIFCLALATQEARPSITNIRAESNLLMISQPIPNRPINNKLQARQDSIATLPPVIRAVTITLVLKKPSHLGTYKTVLTWSCIKLLYGEDMGFTASAMVVFVAPIYTLQHRAQLQAGESILIHSVASGISIMVIQVVMLLKADIYATGNTQEKKNKFSRQLWTKGGPHFQLKRIQLQFSHQDWHSRTGSGRNC